MTAIKVQFEGVFEEGITYGYFEKGFEKPSPIQKGIPIILGGRHVL